MRSVANVNAKSETLNPGPPAFRKSMVVIRDQAALLKLPTFCLERQHRRKNELTHLQQHPEKHK